jgi:hypothetical protein
MGSCDGFCEANAQGGLLDIPRSACRNVVLGCGIRRQSCQPIRSRLVRINSELRPSLTLGLIGQHDGDWLYSDLQPGRWVSLGAPRAETATDGRHEQSLLGAVFQTTIQLSGTIGVCLCSLVQQVVVYNTGNLYRALCITWWMLAGFAWLCKWRQIDRLAA